MLPDVLAPGLDLVFCGTAPSPASFRAGAYYANRGNAFWPTLHAVGLLPAPLAAAAFRDVLAHGLGLTDLAKTEYGSDHELSPDAFDRAALLRKLARFRPAAVAFTSKNAAAAFLGARAVGYGRQPAEMAAALPPAARGIAYFALSSPSGRARSFWTLDPWREAAAFVAARRAARAA
ncbi:MAG: mismatch-specific DNA-glycosylase [Rhodospirillales bacterium]|nr:MAG: mismatch-specific DNA-glycosylase [Rhodospirillales bacterium]